MEAKCVPTLGATVLIRRYLIRELLLNDRLLAILCSMVLIEKQPAASFCGKRSNANGYFGVMAWNFVSIALCDYHSQRFHCYPTWTGSCEVFSTADQSTLNTWHCKPSLPWDWSKPIVLESCPPHYTFLDSDAMILAGLGWGWWRNGLYSFALPIRKHFEDRVTFGHLYTESRGDRGIAVDYEVLGLASGRRHYFSTLVS